MRVRVIDLDGSVSRQPYLAALVAVGEAELVPARDLAGKLRIVANRRALKELMSRLGPADSTQPELIFFGSGDFHHLTYGFLQRLPEPVTVIQFDNHPDWIRVPSTVNCGSWVSRALRDNCCDRVITIGPSGSDLRLPELKGADLALLRRARLSVYPWRSKPSRLLGAPVNAPGVRTQRRRLIWRELADETFSDFIEELAATLDGKPLWITIDKDVLPRDEAVTNWDQSGMALAHVLALVARLATTRCILGIDVCGDYSPPAFSDAFRAFLSWLDRPSLAPDDAHAMQVNNFTNRSIVESVRPLLS